MLNIKKYIIIILLIVGLNGCSKKITNTSITPSSQDIWQLAIAPSSQENQAFILSMSSTIKTKTDSGRVLLNVWGNFNLPIRVDVRNSFGSILVVLQENDTHWTILNQEKNTLQIQPKNSLTQITTGINIPLDISDLANLITKNYTPLLSKTYIDAVPLKQDIKYKFLNKNKTNWVILSPTGLIKELDTEYCSIKFEEFKQIGQLLQPTPSKISIYAKNGDKYIFYIKNFKYIKNAYPLQILSIKIPKTTNLI